MTVKPAPSKPARDLEQKVLELAALHEISKVLTESLDLKVTCARVLKLLSQLLGMERGTFLIRDGGRKGFSIVAAHGMTPEEIERGKYRVGEGIVGNVLATGSPIVIPNLGSEPLFLNRTGSRTRVLERQEIAFICVPVKVRGDVIGVLSVDRVFGDQLSFDHDVRFLTIVAGSLAQAVRISEMVRDEKQRLLDENADLKAELKGRYQFDNIIGTSDRMQEIFGQVDRVSRSTATVMLRGESGTGKELIARAIHYHSPRSGGPFIKLNCAALPETLLESELFGHEKGAFTGAIGEKKGRFELADGGTLFLDEVGDISLAFQTKLLRVLQERQFERIGGTETITVDTRLIAATNKDLEEAVRKGTFREDLYYRLNVIPLFLPSLRERKEDLPPLIEFFLGRFNRENQKQVRITRSVLNELLAYPWPGNIRELQHAVEHIVVMARSNEATADDLPLSMHNGLAHASGQTTPGGPVFAPRAFAPPSLPDGASPPENGTGFRELPSPSSLAETERRLIVEALRKCGGVQSRAAMFLGITPRQIAYRIRKFGI